MKKMTMMAYLMILSLGFSTAFALETDKKTKTDETTPAKTENKMSEEELTRLTKRVEEIRDMDKSDMTAKEKKELRKEVKGIKENVKRDGGYIYIGAGTLLVVILLVILLL
jgi:peptidoglycan hydrolase CwlO-like protein